MARERGRRGRRKVCSFCVDKIDQIGDYKEVGRLRRYITERGKIPSSTDFRKLRPSPTADDYCN